MATETTTELATSAGGIRRRRWFLRTCQVAVLVVAIAAWQLAGDVSGGIRDAVGSPGQVWSVLVDWLGGGDSKWSYIASTVEGALLGCALGVSIAAVLTLAFVVIPGASRLFMPYVAAFNAVPKVVMAPLFVLWLGFGLQSKVAFVASVVFIIVFYNLLTGLRDVDEVYIDHVKALKASRLWVLRSVYLPALVGWIFASLRVSVGFALLLAVVAEYIATNQGVGALIQHAQLTLAPNDVIAGIIIVGVLAVGLDLALRLIERHLLRWRPS